MVRTVLALLALALASGALFGAEPGADNDLQALQGNWKPTAVKWEELDQVTGDMLQQMTAVYDGSEYHLYFVDKGREGPRPLKLAVARVALDPTTSPKTLTFEFARGPLKGQKLHGLYDLAGDRLRLCYGPADKPRPTAFAAPKGSNAFCEEWVRKGK